MSTFWLLQLQAQQYQQPQYPPGVGELPLPYFSSESAGVAPNGTVDLSFQLTTIERSEKKLRERDAKLKNPRMTVDTTASVDDQVYHKCVHSLAHVYGKCLNKHVQVVCVYA